MGILFPSFSDAFRVWNLFNIDTFELLQGQFHPEDMTMDIGSTYNEKFSLNRQHAISQFLHGEVETISFRSRFVATTVIEDLEDHLATLKSFVRRDDSLERPPILEFWVGNGSFNLFNNQTILQSLSGIAYHRPTFLGGLRHVEFTVNLREYKEATVEDLAIGNTRFHRAKFADYYEALAEREYGNPRLGDAIRKLHPDKPNIQTGNVIELPTQSKLRRTKLTQTSIPLQTGFDRKDTPQKVLRQNIFDARNRTKVSFVLREAI